MEKYKLSKCEQWSPEGDPTLILIIRRFIVEYHTIDVKMLPVSAMIAMIVVHSGLSREYVSQIQNLWNKNVEDYVFYDGVWFDIT